MDENDLLILRKLHELGGATSTTLAHAIFKPATRGELKSKDHLLRKRLARLVTGRYVTKGASGGSAFYTLGGPRTVVGHVEIHNARGEHLVVEGGDVLVALGNGDALLIRPS